MNAQADIPMSETSLATVTLEITNKRVEIDDADVQDGTIVSGIALGTGDVTVGQSGVKKKWPAETLKEAAPTLAGKPLVVDHENQSESVVGQVIKSAYKTDVGVIYEAVLYDESLASKIENGLLEVSIRGYHPDPKDMEHTENGAAIISKLVFDNLSIVPDGAAPSNTLKIGEHAELEQSYANLFEGDDVANLTERDNENPSRGDESYTPSEGDYVGWYDEEEELQRFGKVIRNPDDEEGVEVLPSDDNETKLVSEDKVEPWHERDGAENDDEDNFGFAKIVDKHNKRVENEWAKTDVETLNAVYKRGLQAYEEGDSVNKQQFAIARVSAFLKKLRGVGSLSEYTQDNDLLPEDHPDYNADAAGGRAEGIPRRMGEQSQKLIENSLSELYSSKKKAQTRAKELNLEGYHEVAVGDKTMYMPGESHGDFIKQLAIDSGFDEQRVSSLENSDDEEQDWLTDDTLSLYEKVCKEADVKAELLEPVAELESEDKIYREWQDAVNMDADTFEKWMQHPCSDEASIRPKRVQNRNRNLITEPQQEWEDVEYDAAKRAISFIARMRGQRPDNISEGPGGCPSKWAISLMNWGYNPFDELPPEPDIEDAQANLEVHFPEYDSLNAEDNWDAPDFEDFREPYNISDDTQWDELDKETRNNIASHFLYSADGWPPEDFSDLKFPVVSADGTLYLSGLRSAKQFVGRSDIPEDEKNRLREVINDLAKREFDKDWTENEPTEQSVDIPEDDLKILQTQAHSHSRRAKASLQQFKEVYRRGRKTYEEAPDEAVGAKSASEFALERVEQYSKLLELGLPNDERYTEDNDLLPSNHPRKMPMNTDELTEVKPAGFREFAAESGESGASDNTESDTMTEDTEQRIEELEETVEELESRNDELLEEIEAVRSEYAAALSDESPFSEEELVDKFSVEELREKYEENEDAKLADAGPAPQAGDADEAELSADDETQERIEELESQIENYESMGWTAALEQAEKELEELRN